LPCVRAGLLWYTIAIKPLEHGDEPPPQGEWLWHVEGSYNVATRYVCSLYWALSVMTALKGINSHETRQCLWTDPLIERPLEERIFTIFTFIFGATFYSIIYGNIGQVRRSRFLCAQQRTHQLRSGEQSYEWPCHVSMRM
jgi:hypothetical protein